MVNTFHQVGMALGLGVLIAASAHAGHGLTTPAAVLTRARPAPLGVL